MTICVYWTQTVEFDLTYSSLFIGPVGVFDCCQISLLLYGRDAKKSSRTSSYDVLQLPHVSGTLKMCRAVPAFPPSGTLSEKDVVTPCLRIA